MRGFHYVGGPIESDLLGLSMTICSRLDLVSAVIFDHYVTLRSTYFVTVGSIVTSLCLMVSILDYLQIHILHGLAFHAYLALRLGLKISQSIR